MPLLLKLLNIYYFPSWDNCSRSYIILVITDCRFWINQAD